MLNVAYNLSLGSASRQSGKTSDLLAVETHAALGIPVNTCRVALAGLASVRLRAYTETTMFKINILSVIAYF